MLVLLLSLLLQQPAPVAAVDPTGFGPLLNAYRATNKLAVVRYDASLTALAATNNREQVRRGMGHYVMPTGTAWQCVGWGYPTAQAMLAGWIGSPPHRKALLSKATVYGVSYDGRYWTLNLKQ